MHLLFGALPEGLGAARVNAEVAIIAIGNEYRRDDGVGMVVLRQLTEVIPAGTGLTCVDGEPSRLMDAWDGSRLVILLDAAVCEPAHPGRIHRSTVIEAESAASTSSHGLGVPEAVELARVLHRLPERLVLLTVEAADTGYGLGLSPQVEAAVPALVAAIQVELGLGPAERA
jgi:hydrogenase maturation protease